MTVKRILRVEEYRGLSTDDKPTLEYHHDAVFYEEDTGKELRWTGSQWEERYDEVNIKDNVTAEIEGTADVKVTNDTNNPVPTEMQNKEFIGPDSVYGALIAENSPTPLRVGASNLSGRHTIIVNVLEGEDVYYGFDDNVTTENGLFITEEMHFPVKDNVTLYAIAPPNEIENEDVGTGDGNTDTFHLDNIPVVEDSETITVDGEEATRVDENPTGKLEYTLDYSDGEVIFGDPPDDGDAIVADYDQVDTVDIRIAELKE